MSSPLPHPPLRAGIALGSNLGDRLAHLQSARNLLKSLAPAGEPFLQASLYQTQPVDCPPESGEFLNTVVELAFSGTPLELLQAARHIESTLGRVRNVERNAPRVIDVDLLYFGNHILHTAELELPHPRMTQRRFVLEPLAEIRPSLRLPSTSAEISVLLLSLNSTEPPLFRAYTSW